MASSSPQRRPHLRFISDLSQCLFDFVIQLLPPNDELSIKEDVRLLLQRLIRTIEPTSRLLAFGSTANGFSLRNSDMDLCCLIDSGERLNASDLVTMCADLLERETKFHVKPLPHARIPIVKLSLDPAPGLPFGIACDIGFENRLAIENTRLLYSYAKIDPTRVRTLVLFLKIWSKRRKINSPYKGTLSSYGYVLLVIYFLIHVKNPPVLPNLQQMPPLRPINTEETTLNGYNVWFFDDTDLLAQRWHSENSESVAELLIDFFRYFSRDFSYNTGVASIRMGLMKKEIKGWGSGSDFTDSSSVGRGAASERNRLCIEDPFETDYNVARCVTKDGLYTIRGEFMRASRILATRPDRAIIALAELCEERKAEDLVIAPSRGGRRPYHHNAALLSPITGGEETIMAERESFFELAPAVSVPLVIRDPRQVEKVKKQEEAGTEEKNGEGVKVKAPVVNMKEEGDDDASSTNRSPRSRSSSRSRSRSRTRTPSRMREESPSIRPSTAILSPQSPTSASASTSTSLSQLPPQPIPSSSLASPTSDSPSEHVSLGSSMLSLSTTTTITTNSPSTSLSTSTFNNDIVPPLPQLSLPSQHHHQPTYHHSSHQHQHTSYYHSPTASRHPSSSTQTPHTTTSHIAPHTQIQGLPPPPNIASHTHMLPKRSKWTSPPPEDASFDDRAVYESQLDRSLELGTRRVGQFQRFGSGPEFVSGSPIGGSVAWSGSGGGGESRVAMFGGSGQGWARRRDSRSVADVDVQSARLGGAVGAEGSAWEGENEEDGPVLVGDKPGEREQERGGELFEDDVDSLLGDRPHRERRRSDEVMGKVEDSGTLHNAAHRRSQRPLFGFGQWGGYDHGLHASGHLQGQGQDAVNLGSPPSSIASPPHTNTKNLINDRLTNGSAINTITSENDPDAMTEPPLSPSLSLPSVKGRRKEGEPSTVSSSTTTTTSSSNTLITSSPTPPISTGSTSGFTSTSSVGAMASPSMSASTSVIAGGTDSNADSVTSSPRSEGCLGAGAGATGAGSSGMHHSHLHQLHHLNPYAGVNVNMNVLGGVGGLYRRTSSSSHSHPTRGQQQSPNPNQSPGQGHYYPIPQSPRHQQQWTSNSPLLGAGTTSPEMMAMAESSQQLPSSPHSNPPHSLSTSSTSHSREMYGRSPQFVVQSPPRLSGMFANRHGHHHHHHHHHHQQQQHHQQPYSRAVSGGYAGMGVGMGNGEGEVQQVFYQTGGTACGSAGGGRSPRLSGERSTPTGGDASPGGVSPLLAQYQAQLVQLQQLQALHERQLAFHQQQQQQQQLAENAGVVNVNNNVLPDALASLGMRSGGGLSGRVGLGTPPTGSFVPTVVGMESGGSRSESRNQHKGRESPLVLKLDIEKLKRTDSSTTTINATNITTVNLNGTGDNSASMSASASAGANTLNTQAPTPVRMTGVTAPAVSSIRSENSSRTGSRINSPVSALGSVKGITREEEERFHAMATAADATTSTSANTGADTEDRDAGAESSKSSKSMKAEKAVVESTLTVATPTQASSSSSGTRKANVKGGGTGKREKSSEKGGGRKREKSPMKSTNTGKRDKSSDARSTGAGVGGGSSGGMNGAVSANGKANGVVGGKASGAGNGKAIGGGGTAGLSGNGSSSGNGNGNSKTAGGAGTAGASASGGNGGGKGKQKQKQKRRNGNASATAGTTTNANGVKPDAPKASTTKPKTNTTSKGSTAKSNPS